MEDNNKKKKNRKVIDADPIIMGAVFSKIGAEIVVHVSSETEFTLTPNVYHLWGVVESLTLELEHGNTNNMEEYMFEFRSGNTPATLTLPASVKWQEEPEIEPNMLYQVSIMNNVGLIVGVNLS